MKTLLKLGEMLQYLPTELKDAVHHVAKDAGAKTDDLELHRHAHSEKAAVNGLDPKSRCALKYVSARTQDRDDEIVIPEVIKLDQFRKYMHVLFNHNYSLPPLGSDRTIDYDDFGIKALTEYADTGPGTMANIMWALVSQGHQKASSIGFVPTSFTKPGARDWDHITNQLQSNWKEFDKSRAEKSISRIITGGVLLEHSDVTVPCNVDAETVQVIKALHPDEKVLKQFGWHTDPKSGLIVTKAEAEPVPCVCDECGFLMDAVPGGRCPECKTGVMKAKGKEKAIEVRVISKGGAGSGNFGHEGRPGEVGGSGGGGGDVNKEDEKYNTGAQRAKDSDFGVGDRVKITGKVTGQGKMGTAVGFDKDGSYAMVRVGDKIHSYHNSDVSAAGNDEEKGFHSHAIEKPNPHMPGGSFTACVAIMEDKGHDTESAQKICGALQADAGGKGLTEAETKAVEEYTGARKATGIPCVCDECGAEDDTNPGEACQEDGCTGVMRPVKGEEKSVPEIKVFRPAPSVKVLFVPPSAAELALRVGEAVEKALSRRTGKIL